MMICRIEIFQISGTLKKIMIIFIIIISIIIMKFYARENELILMKQLKNSAPSFLVITG